MTSAPALVPYSMTSAYISTASSNDKSPSGSKSLPVGPKSSAIRASVRPVSSLAFFACSTALVTISSRLSGYFNLLAPNVLVLMISHPASR